MRIIAPSLGPDLIWHPVASLWGKIPGMDLFHPPTGSQSGDSREAFQSLTETAGRPALPARTRLLAMPEPPPSDVKLPDLENLPEPVRRCLTLLRVEYDQLVSSGELKGLADPSALLERIARRIVDGERKKGIAAANVETLPAPGFLVTLLSRSVGPIKKGVPVEVSQQSEVGAASRETDELTTAVEAKALQEALAIYWKLAPATVNEMWRRLEGVIRGSPASGESWESLAPRVVRLIQVLEAQRRRGASRASERKASRRPVLPGEVAGPVVESRERITARREKSEKVVGPPKKGRRTREEKERRLAEIIREGPALMGVAQTKFLQLSGINPSTWWGAIQDGLWKPGLRTLVRFCRLLFEKTDLKELYECYNTELEEIPFYGDDRVYRVRLGSVALEEALSVPFARFLREKVEQSGLSVRDFSRKIGLPTALVMNLYQGLQMIAPWSAIRRIAEGVEEDSSLVYLRIHKEIPAFLVLVDGESRQILSRPRKDRFDFDDLERRFKEGRYSSFAGVFQAIRRKAGLELAVLSRTSDIPSMTLQNYETGQSRPRLDNLYRICSSHPVLMERRAELYWARYPELAGMELVSEGHRLMARFPEGWDYRRLCKDSLGRYLEAVVVRFRSWHELAQRFRLSHETILKIHQGKVLDISFTLVGTLAEVTGEDPGFLAFLAHPELVDFFNVVDSDGLPIRPEGHGEPFDYQFRYRARLEALGKGLR